MLISENKKTIPSETVLLTVAKVTMNEPNRLEAAKKWLGVNNVFGLREEYFLSMFWVTLDNMPDPEPVAEIKPRHKVYK